MFAEYLFVVGGSITGADGQLIENKTEIVSLTEGESIPEGLNALADHPRQENFGAGGALPDAGKTQYQIIW